MNAVLHSDTFQCSLSDLGWSEKSASKPDQWFKEVLLFNVDPFNLLTSSSLDLFHLLTSSFSQSTIKEKKPKRNEVRGKRVIQVEV